jgi:hypothetical protein
METQHLMGVACGWEGEEKHMVGKTRQVISVEWNQSPGGDVSMEVPSLLGAVEDLT